MQYHSPHGFGRGVQGPLRRTYVYIDGFNLYYGALKGTSHKWLDVRALFKSLLRPENEILKIEYYTARVSARPDNPDAPTRQDFYLQALEAHIPELEITQGHFIQKPVKMRLVEKMRFRRSMYVRVLKSEEKGSDVNLSVHLVNDAWNNRYDCAVVCSNDGDMAEAMRIVRRERHKSVVLVVPGDPAVRPASSQLRRWASIPFPERRSTSQRIGLSGWGNAPCSGTLQIMKEVTMAGIPRKQGRAQPKIGPSDSSDTLSDRPQAPDTDSDAGGTGERQTIGKVPERHEAGTDRVVNSEEAGLGGGLDQAEEARLGVTDEKLQRRKKARPG